MKRISSIVMAALVLLALTQASFAQADEWVPVRDTSLGISPGSALDFSRFLPDGPAGRVPVETKNGRLASKDGTPLRFHCGSIAWSPPTGGYPDHAGADRYAEQLRRHGYNVVRIHYADLDLMEGQAQDFDYNSEELDRFHYFLSALKKQGIYWIIDAMTSVNGAIGNIKPHRWTPIYDLKYRVYFDPIAQAHWRRMADTILARKNPYTGVAPLRDNALILVILVNENEVEIVRPPGSDKHPDGDLEDLAPQFRTWLAARYGTIDALNKAWHASEKEYKDFGETGIPNPKIRGPVQIDFQRFLVALHQETYKWMSQYLQSLGYSGLSSMYDTAASLNSHLMRANQPSVDQHSYFDHPKNGETLLTQQSSVSQPLFYARLLASSRWLGKPFTVTEFDQPYWNQFRRESGIVIPALARLHGWDIACRYAAGPIELSYEQIARRKRTLYPFFSIGLDPIARVSETLGFLLFTRADVAEGTTTVGVELPEIGNPGENLPAGIDRLSLVTRFGLFKGPPPPDIVRFDASSLPPSTDHATKVSVETEERVRSVFTAALERLRRDGKVPASNMTNADKGIYQTMTGELTLDIDAKTVRVATPRTDAISFLKAASDLPVGALTVRQGSDPALIAVTALDGDSIETAKNVLVMVASDAAASKMTFTDATRREVVSFGELPVLVKRAVVKFSLKVAPSDAWLLTSLHLNGDRGENLPITVNPEGLDLILDNVTSHGPTTFWLLSRQP